MKHLEPGDIVLVVSDGLVGWLIRRLRSRDGKATYVNHVAMVVNGVMKGTVDPDADAQVYTISGTHDARPWPRAVLMDAQPPRVARRMLEAYAGKLVAIYRPKLPYVERVRIARRACEYDRKWYGLSKIFLHLFGLAGLARFDRFPICSWTVAVPFQAEGYSFGVDAGVARPDDIHDWVKRRPQLFEEIRPLGILEA